MNKPNQRIGAISDAHVGRVFESVAKKFFQEKGLTLHYNIKIPVGVENCVKDHAFDLGCDSQKSAG